MRKIKLIVAIIGVIVITFSIAYSAEVYVKGWYDESNDWFVIDWKNDKGELKRAIWDAPNKIEPVIEPIVSYSQKDGSYTYAYIVSNLSGIQPLYIIQVEHYYAISDATKPNTNWYMGDHEEGDLFEWAKTRKKPKGILPGESAQGFSFKSMGLPAIVNSIFYGYKRVRFKDPGDYDSSEVNAAFSKVYRELLAEYPEKDKDVVLKTIGPTAPPEELEPADFLQGIIDMKHEATAQGWITNKGIERSLDAKLDAALKKFQSGNTKAAANILGAFINEVEAQGCETYEDCPKGKHLSPEAYALLKYNAQYLIDNLKK